MDFFFYQDCLVIVADDKDPSSAEVWVIHPKANRGRIKVPRSRLKRLGSLQEEAYFMTEKLEVEEAKRFIEDEKKRKVGHSQFKMV